MKLYLIHFKNESEKPVKVDERTKDEISYEVKSRIPLIRIGDNEYPWYDIGRIKEIKQKVDTNDQRDQEDKYDKKMREIKKWISENQDQWNEAVKLAKAMLNNNEKPEWKNHANFGKKFKQWIVEYEARQLCDLKI